jgi:predicted nucleotide-binding protein
MSDERLGADDPRRAAMQIVFDVFHEAGVWPTYQHVDRQLYRRGFQAAEILAAIPLELAQFDRYHPQPHEIKLTVAGIAELGGGHVELEVFLRAIRWLARRENEYEPSPTEVARLDLTSTDFIEDEHLAVDRTALVKVLEMLRVEWVTTGSNGPGEGEPVWQVSVDERIRPYAAAASVEDYLAIRGHIRDQAEQRLPAWHPASEPAAAEDELPEYETADAVAADPHKVFVVNGRNEAVRIAMFELLRAFGLHPLEWTELRAATRKPSSYIGEILDAGFAMSQACVVLMTPDEEVRLREDFVEDELERIVAHQPRPNVLIEAGMALDKYRDRTVIVELGKMRQVSDLAGIHTLRMNDSIERRKELAERLRDAQCSVRIEGSAWHSAGRFDEAIGAGPPISRMPIVDTETERARGQRMAQLRQEYILSHDNLSSSMLAGTEPLPSDWLRRRLRELGLTGD